MKKRARGVRRGTGKEREHHFVPPRHEPPLPDSEVVFGSRGVYVVRVMDISGRPPPYQAGAHRSVAIFKLSRHAQERMAIAALHGRDLYRWAGAEQRIPARVDNSDSNPNVRAGVQCITCSEPIIIESPEGRQWLRQTFAHCVALAQAWANGPEGKEE